MTAEKKTETSVEPAKRVERWTDEEIEEACRRQSPEDAEWRHQAHLKDAWLFRDAMRHLSQDDATPSEELKIKIEPAK